MKEKANQVLVVTVVLTALAVVYADPIPAVFPHLEVGHSGNTINDGRRSVAIGDLNNMGTAYKSLAVGHLNTVGEPGLASMSFASGRENTVAGDYCAAMGRMLIVNPIDDGTSSVIVGQYNDTEEYELDGVLVKTDPNYDRSKEVAFAVGTGYDQSGNGYVEEEEHNNGIIVYYDGSVIVPAVQGDIGMGQFGQ